MCASQIARSPVTNRWGEVPLRPVPHQEFIVYRGSAGHAYSHHPQLTSVGGRLVASWSHGIRNEDDPGQVMCYACSEDAGVTWNEPQTVLPRLPEGYVDDPEGSTRAAATAAIPTATARAPSSRRTTG